MSHPRSPTHPALKAVAYPSLVATVGEEMSRESGRTDGDDWQEPMLNFTDAEFQAMVKADKEEHERQVEADQNGHVQTYYHTYLRATTIALTSKCTPRCPA